MIVLNDKEILLCVETLLCVEMSIIKKLDEKLKKALCPFLGADNIKTEN